MACLASLASSATLPPLTISDLIAGVPGVDLLDGHINGVLCALAVNGGAAGHRADNAHTNDVVFLAIRCGSGAGRASLEAAASPCWALEPQPANRLADMAAATVSAKTLVRFFIV